MNLMNARMSTLSKSMVTYLPSLPSALPGLPGADVTAPFSPESLDTLFQAAGVAALFGGAFRGGFFAGAFAFGAGASFGSATFCTTAPSFSGSVETVDTGWAFPDRRAAWAGP